MLRSSAQSRDSDAPSVCCFVSFVAPLLVVLTALPALAETLKEKADRLCHAYVDRPEDFKEIPTHPCEAHEPGRTEYRSMQCFSHAVEGLSVAQTFASGRFGGSCSSTGIVRIGSNNSILFTPTRNASVNGYGMGSDDKALDYRGTLLITDGNDLRLVFEHDEVILCRFVYKFEGWREPEPKESETCQKFAQDEFSDRSSPIAAEERHSWPRYPEARPVRQVQSDLNSDGADETILSYFYASGAGCGCDAYPLVPLHNGGLIPPQEGNALDSSAPPALKALGLALQDLTTVCNSDRRGTKWLVVRISGKDFVLADFRPDPWDTPLPAGTDVYSIAEIPSRELYEFQSDRFVRICEQRPVRKKIIAHEIIAKDALDYTPVTQ